MKFNVKPSDCRFVVNKEKKTVVCVYEGSKRAFLDFISENSKLKDLLCPIGSCQIKLRRKMFMPDRYIGVAVCGPDDEWNEETGKLIAFSRMKDKLNKSFFKRANTFVHTIDSWVNETVDLLNTIGEKLEVNQTRRHEHIEKLIGDKQ